MTDMTPLFPMASFSGVSCLRTLANVQATGSPALLLYSGTFKADVSIV